MTRACAVCDGPILGRRESALYCSDACSMVAYRARRSVAAGAAGEAPVSLTRLPPGLKPTTRRVLRALIAAGGRGATTHELCQPQVGGTRFGGRLHELRELGFVIARRQERAGRWRYWLVSSPDSARLFDASDRRAA